VLSYLPNTSIASLRLVSRAHNKEICTVNPTLFVHLHIEFPTTSLSAPQLDTLNKLAKQCRDLTITFPTTPLATDPPLSEVAKLPELPALKRLHLICPTVDIYDRLLAFRLALEKSAVPQLSRLTIASLSITGIVALRFGAFTAFAESTWTNRSVWRRLHCLGVKLTPWWDIPHNATGRKMDKAQEEIWCMGVKILHDWLNSFAAAGKLKELKFAWQGAEGPNPLLLDEVAAGSGRGGWFSAPPIRARSLKRVWFRGVGVGVEDVSHLSMRMEGLEMLMVEGRLVGEGVRGVRRVVRGREWYEVALGEGEMCGEEAEGGSEVDALVMMDNTPVLGSRNGGYFR